MASLVATGQITITDTNDIIYISLSQDSIPISVNADWSGGIFTASSSSTATVMIGSVAVTGWIFSNTFSGGVVCSEPTSSATQTVTSISASAGSINFSATKDGITITKTCPVIKVRQGATGPAPDSLVMYFLTNGTVTPTSTSGTANPPAGGWTTTIQTAPCYVTSATKSGSTGNYTSAWSTPILYNGSSGSSGDSIDIIFIRSAFEPTPNPPIPLTFPTLPTNWYSSVSAADVAGGTNIPLWSSAGTRTAGTGDYTWEKVSRVTGETAIELVIFSRLAGVTPPTIGSGSTYNFSTKTFNPPNTGANVTWTSTIPSGSNSVWTSRAVASSSVGSITSISVTGWSTPVLSIQNGADSTVPGPQGPTVVLTSDRAGYTYTDGILDTASNVVATITPTITGASGNRTWNISSINLTGGVGTAALASFSPSGTATIAAATFNTHSSVTVTCSVPTPPSTGSITIQRSNRSTAAANADVTNYSSSLIANASIVSAHISSAVSGVGANLYPVGLQNSQVTVSYNSSTGQIVLNNAGIGSIAVSGIFTDSLYANTVWAGKVNANQINGGTITAGIIMQSPIMYFGKTTETDINHTGFYLGSTGFIVGDVVSSVSRYMQYTPGNGLVLKGCEIDAKSINCHGAANISSNIAFGLDALGSTGTSGSDNLAFGDSTLRLLTSGIYNIAIGKNALSNTTSGNTNIAIGPTSLCSNKTGNLNIAIGGTALYTNDSGDNNIAIGMNTLYTNSNGTRNIAIGVTALYTNSNGIENVAIGDHASYYSSFGRFNVAIGDSALFENVGGYHNVAIGTLSLNGTSTYSCYFNTAIGSCAMQDISDGDYNTAIGYNTGLGIITGNNNTIIGAQVSGLDPALTSNIIIANGTGTIKARHDGANWTLTGDKLQVNGNIVVTGTITAGTPATPGATGYVEWSGVLSKPTTLTGYGITDSWLADGGWKPTSLSAATRLIGKTSPDGGEFGLAYSGGQVYPYCDGFFYQNEGQYRVIDSNSIANQTVLNATNATNATNLAGTGGNYIYSAATGTSYSAAIQVREAVLGGANGGAIAYAPRLAFHWSGLVASSICMEANGRIAICNNPGTGYEAFIAGAIQATSFFDGYTTFAAAQINRAGAQVELQYAGSANSTVGIGCYGSKPIVFNANTGTGTFSGAIQVGSGSPVSWGNTYASNAPSIYGSGSSIYINPQGAVGTIGTFSSTGLSVTGTITSSSDERYKTNWRELPYNYIDRLSNIKMGIFDWIDRSDKNQVGVSAQSLMTLLPEAVIYDETNSRYTVSYGNAALVSTIELAKEIVMLKNQIALLQNRLDSSIQRVE